MRNTKIAGYQVHPAAKLFPLMVGAEFEALCNDIRENGLSDDIVLWRTGGQDWLLDGRNRGRACEATGINPTFTYYDGSDPFGYVVSHNLLRRHLTDSQRAMVGARLKDRIEKENPPDKGGNPANYPQPEANLPQAARARRPQPRDQAAKMVGVGGRSVQKAAKVIEHGHPELQASVDAGLVKVDLAAQIADKTQKEQLEIVRKIAADPAKGARTIARQHDRDAVTSSVEEEAPMPEGPFRVILVDFPWAYGKRPDDGTQRGQTMSKGDIEIFAADRLRPLAHDDAVLFLCITNAHLVNGDHVAVLKAAGFTGKTILSWDKGRMDTGDWFHGQTEHFIMATKGRPTIGLSNQETVLPMISEKRCEGGQKPEGLYELIESLCPGNRVELFSRGERPNWTAWIAETSTPDSEGDE